MIVIDWISLALIGVLGISGFFNGFAKEISSAIAWVVSRLASYDSDPQLIEVSRRNNVLYPFPPPGSDVIVGSRD